MIPQKEYDEKLRIAREHSHAADAWTDEEKETLRRMLAQGYTLKQVAEVLPRRTQAAVDRKYRSMRLKGEI